MGVTLCCGTAMDVIRELRNRGEALDRYDRIKLRPPRPWVRERFSLREFTPDVWQWESPSKTLPLDVLVPTSADRIRMPTVKSYVCKQLLPPEAIMCLDSVASVVCPELLFIQMAPRMSLAAAVMLGHELCGHYSRDPEDPLFGDVTMDVAPATSVGRIATFIDNMKGLHGAKQARGVLRYVCDNALSAPESVLATMGALPSFESAYGLGAVTLNDRVNVADEDELQARRNRYPDLLFSFASVGINYDGQDHLDLQGLVDLARADALSDGDDRAAALQETQKKLEAIRKKVLDDTVRNNELMSRGRCVLVATKENLESGKELDKFMRRLLECAHATFGVDITSAIARIDDTDKAHDRASLLSQIYPQAGGKRPKRHTF